MKKILILGGGFAGVEAAIYLRKNNHQVTLVSQRDYFYIYPTSIWIPTGEKSREDVSIPLASLAQAHGFEFVQKEIQEIKAKEKIAICTDGTKLDGYDALIIAIGHSKTKIEGMQEHTLSICGEPEEAEMMRVKIEKLVQEGGGRIAFGFGGNPKDKSSVRGGPVFEVMFNVHNYLKKIGLRDKFELTFFAPMQKPGEKMGEKALVMMDKMLGMTKINKKVGSKITSFESDGILFEDGTKLNSDLTIFTAAGMGHDVFASSDLPLSDAGYIITNEFNKVEGIEDVWAIGDSALLLGSPEWKAKQGHVAEVMARNVAHNITNPNDKKSYIDHLNILCVMDIGNGAAFVYRSTKRAMMVPMPIIGHWIKLGWGWYCRNSKLGKIPRIPGM
ncbi:MAG TPA: sulfide:quinone reductase [Epsilonproteobacteria bacterium]|nr:sulfide:quinone reductase [Campylobacterota bacterium]